MFPETLKIIDISQPVNSKTACFPGDVPFSRAVTLTYADSNVVNLTAITLSPHVGTHADAHSHIQGDMSEESDNAGGMPLDPFVGTAVVLDVSPMRQGEISAEMLAKHARLLDDNNPSRVLIKTQTAIDYYTFEEEYPCFSLDAIEFLHARKVKLLGIDCPSVDHIRAKTLSVHHSLAAKKMYWLENLDLTTVRPGAYFLVAAPIKLTEVEAAPVRAFLMTES